MLSNDTGSLLENSGNGTCVTRKFRFQLVAILMILVGLFSNHHLVSAQQIYVTQVDPNVKYRMGPNGPIFSRPVDGEYLPIRTIMPQYPPRAQQRGISGWNLISFSVNEDGSVDVDSIVVIDSVPPDIFDSSSIRAVAQYEFQPPTVNGVEVGIRGIQHYFRYVFPETKLINRDYLPLNHITPKYPLAARKENLEGAVLVEFTITKQGKPAGIVILDRSPSNIFNESAINAAERLRFSPRIMDGEPVAAEGAQYRFSFKLDD